MSDAVGTIDKREYSFFLADGSENFEGHSNTRK